ncbi:hypothetical protein [Hymenobacter rubidus]|uniref:hypothetical protein n=1 Tax=Hymenobacter rubidus TaxID=1441626 RepID=UPI00191D54C2|nr:hypothetical protein [Hymenobacter rubidus]
MLKLILPCLLMLPLFSGCSKKDATQNAPVLPPSYASASFAYQITGYSPVKTGALVELGTFPGARTDRYEVRIIANYQPKPGSTTNGVESIFLFYNKPSKSSPDTDFVLHDAQLNGFDSFGFFGTRFSPPLNGTLTAGTKPGTWSGTFSAGSGGSVLVGQFVNLEKSQ